MLLDAVCCEGPEYQKALSICDRSTEKNTRTWQERDQDDFEIGHVILEISRDWEIG